MNSGYLRGRGTCEQRQAGGGLVLLAQAGLSRQVIGKEAGLYSEGSEYHVLSLNTFQRRGKRSRGEVVNGCRSHLLEGHRLPTLVFGYCGCIPRPRSE